MLKRFFPDLYFDSVSEIRPEILKEKNIKGIILDVDDTLVGFRAKEPSDSVTEWMNLMKKNGVKLCILSNNNGERVQHITKLYDIPGVHRAFKPFRWGFFAAAKKLGIKPSEMAVAGDQIFTDVWGANASKMISILIKPIDLRTDPYFRIKRSLEKIVLKRYAEKSGMINK